MGFGIGILITEGNLSGVYTRYRFWSRKNWKNVYDCLRAFYVFPNIKNTGFSSQQAQDDFLELSGVAAISGTSFGKMGEGYIRFSYANSLDKIEDAMERIKKLLLK